MNRRNFLSKSAIVAAGSFMPAGWSYGLPVSPFSAGRHVSDPDLTSLFLNPPVRFSPWVRWWWNGNKVVGDELVRELRLLKSAGIGGVEINPVQFPSRFPGDDLGLPSLEWLGNAWLDMLSVTFSEAKALGISCDLIVGSGWPFGGEYLDEEEQTQIVVIAVRKISGPQEYEISRDELLKEADPAVSSPYDGRTMKLLSLYLVPDPLNAFEQVNDLSEQSVNEIISVRVPEGDHALYALVRINGFMQVINGTPGADGPVLNHYNEAAVKKYLARMTETIERRTGPLSENIRALFIDSMELEGANWSADMLEVFRQRNGYDIFPYLPFVLFKTGSMGNISDRNYGVRVSARVQESINRMRYDFEVTRAEMLEERFLHPFAECCRSLGVKSRMQAYGRGFFPLESSFAVDIPECESWTMNWLKHRVGEEMPESDYRRGRAYTMINKYVSSAAHLTGTRLISCEEMTDTYTVFNTSLENLKIGGDQSAISGVTHSVFHGFNYSPPEAPYPGWLRYGGYYNEQNNWWPYFHLYNKYKARLSAVLQNVTMYADIAILPPQTEMWGEIGAQSDPFPDKAYVDYMTLIWEAIVKNGGGCDYLSERVVADSVISNGTIGYGPRKYTTLFLVRTKSLDVKVLEKVLEFVKGGGKVFCMEVFPDRAPGYNNHEERDAEVIALVDRLKEYPSGFVLLQRPENDFIGWYRELQHKHMLQPYIIMENPDPFVMQARYTGDDGTEMVYIINSHIHEARTTAITFSPLLTRGRRAWLWDAVTGERYMLRLKNDSVDLELGPGDSYLFVFDKHKNGPAWDPIPASGASENEITQGWSAEFIHCREKTVQRIDMNRLTDLKEMPDFASFSGTVIYRNKFIIEDTEDIVINLGKVYGVSELKINGRDCATGWYGRRICRIGKYLVRGENSIEVKVVTSMGNYMKSLTDNPIAQYWTNERNKKQPQQSMGLTGPVKYYKEL